MARFRKEYERIKRLDVRGVVKIMDIVHAEDGFALVLENFEGASLESLLEKKKN